MSQYKVAVLIYDQVDILDFSGPAEFLSRISDTDNSDRKCFDVKLVGSKERVNAGIVPFMLTSNTLINEGLRNVESYDVLVIPGADLHIIQDMLQKDGAEMKFITAFAALPIRPADERVILSVCTGALLLAATGTLHGLRATTHHTALDWLKKVDSSIDVQSSVEGAKRQRYVDAGLSKNGTRIITAGGVTCGMDASLFVGQL